MVNRMSKGEREMKEILGVAFEMVGMLEEFEDETGEHENPVPCLRRIIFELKGWRRNGKERFGKVGKSRKLGK